MALFSCRYLTSSPFQPTISRTEFNEYVASGYCSLQDYTAASWHHHIRYMLTAGSSSASVLGDPVKEPLFTFFSQSGLLDAIPDRHPTVLGISGSLSAADIRDIVEGCESGSILCRRLEEQIDAIRNLIEAGDDTVPPNAGTGTQKITKYRSLHGALRYKCNRSRCHRFASGFRLKGDRDRHSEDHDRPYKCSAETCYARVIGFASQWALEDHNKRQHGPATSSDQALFPSTREKKTDRDTLSSACARGDLDAVQRYIATGMDLENTGGRGKGALTPLVLATRHGHVNICKTLVEHGCNPFSSAHPRIYPKLRSIVEACKRGDLDLFSVLFFSVPPEDNRWIHFKQAFYMCIEHAALGNFGDIVRLLLQWHSYNPDGISLVEFVSKDAFLRPGTLALEEARDTILNRSRDQGGEGEEKKWCLDLSWSNGSLSPLHRACIKGCSGVVEFLCDQLEKEDISRVDYLGDTPLHSVAGGTADGDCALAIATRLVATGAMNLTATNNIGQTAFSVAASSKANRTNMMEFLWKHQPSLAQQCDASTDGHGWPPLIHTLSDGVPRSHLYFLLRLPEAEAIVEASRNRLSAAVGPYKLTFTFLSACLETKLVDVAKRLLGDGGLTFQSLPRGTETTDPYRVERSKLRGKAESIEDVELLRLMWGREII